MNELRVNRIYRHFKGDYYLVEGIVIHSENKEEMVLEHYMVMELYMLDLKICS